MKRILQKLEQVDRVYTHLFSLIAAVYLINFSVLCYYATGNPITRISGEWYWAQKFFLYSPIYSFFLSVIIVIVSYWYLCDALRDAGGAKANGVNPHLISRWMVYSSTFFSIGIIYFSIAFWIL